jgi:hypothetical protein
LVDRDGGKGFEGPDNSTQPHPPRRRAKACLGRGKPRPYE